MYFPSEGLSAVPCIGVLLSGLSWLEIRTLFVSVSTHQPTLNIIVRLGLEFEKRDIPMQNDV